MADHEIPPELAALARRIQALREEARALGLFAEDRGLLPVKDRRFDDYALRVARLDVGRRKDAGDAFSTIADTIWRRVASLAKMIDKGDPSVGLPPYNGGLFSGEATPLLASLSLGDNVMAEALDILSWEQRGGRRRYINYRDLSVQQLGSIYERLLEFELVRDETGTLDIRPNIFARKNSGSYYTPDDLVLLILDETLAPLIDDVHNAFKNRLASLKPGDSEDFKFSELQKVDPAKAITRLDRQERSRDGSPSIRSGEGRSPVARKFA